MPFVDLDHMKLAYSISGIGAPLICLSGFMADSKLWQGMAKILEADFTLITIDNRGVGQSSAPDGPYTIDMMADDVLALMDHLKIDKAHFVGHSMGGMIVMSCMQKAPERFLSAVLASTALKLSPRTQFFLRQYPKVLEYDQQQQEPIKPLILAAFSFSNAILKEQALLDMYFNKQNQSPAEPIAVAKHQLYACLEHDFESIKPQSYAFRICVCCGDDDILTTVEDAQNIAQKLKGSTVTVCPGAGHILQFENSQLFCQIIQQTCKESRQ